MIGMVVMAINGKNSLPLVLAFLPQNRLGKNTDISEFSRACY
ncbi:hypothetical protein [Planktothrix agardhii]|nr:hypothetical protein [Planktothrix agardhii]